MPWVGSIASAVLAWFRPQGNPRGPRNVRTPVRASSRNVWFFTDVTYFNTKMATCADAPGATRLP